jgi:hypothetical protein
MPEVTDNINLICLENQTSIYYTPKQNNFLFTEDELKLKLNEYHRIIKRKIGWAMPLSIFLSLLAIIITADFVKEKFGISPAIWEAIFIIILIASFIWLSYTIYYLFKYCKKGTAVQFIGELKENKQTTTMQPPGTTLPIPTSTPTSRQTRKRKKKKKKRR